VSTGDAMAGRRSNTRPGEDRKAAPIYAFCSLLWLSFAFYCVLAGDCAFAQQSGPDLSNVSLEELSNIQVYSASRHLQSASEAPSSVTVITGDEIQKYGYRTLADILRAIRGFYVTYDRNYSFVGVRGFEYLGDWDSRILLLVDGHRINNNVSNAAMFGTEFPIDVDLIQRVEIIRGPTSSLYGSDAFLAVINVVTRRPSELKHFEVSFEPASFGTYEERASYGGRYRGVGMTLSGTFYNSAGQTLFFPEFNSPATNYGITRNTDDEDSQHALATISFRDFTLQGMFSHREKGNPTAYFGTVFNDPRTRNFDDQQYVDLKYEHALAENWSITARTSYDQYRLQSPLAAAPASSGAPVSVDRFSERGNWWTGEVKLSRKLLEKHNLTFGSEVRDNLRQDEGDFTGATGQFARELNSSWIGALYAQAELALTGKLGLSAGIRYDHYSTFGGTTSPRLGLIYHPFEGTTLKAVYGSAFNAPASIDTTPGYGPFYEDNRQLQPETIHSAEGVVEQKLGGHFTASGSVFENKIDRLISLEPDPTNGLFVYRNVGKADASGVEAELNGRFAGGLEGTASYSYANAQDLLDHAVLEDSPHHLGKLNLVLPLVPARLFASLNAQYMSARQTLANNTVGGFAVFNGTLLARNLGKHLDLSVSLYNILDRKYFDPGRVEDVEDAIQQDGRNFRVKVTARF
jgi:outer membrane receptor for ferrienterochelin and colicin